MFGVNSIGSSENVVDEDQRVSVHLERQVIPSGGDDGSGISEGGGRLLVLVIGQVRVFFGGMIDGY